MWLAIGLAFIVGLFIGTNLGVVIMCVLQVNRGPRDTELEEEGPWMQSN